MRISCLQTNPKDNLEENVQFLFKQAHLAKAQGAELIVFPEMFSYMGESSRRWSTRSSLNSGIFDKISLLAKELKTSIVAGSHAEEIPGDTEKVYNSCVAYDAAGNQISLYRKAHLFNLLSAEGKKLYCESDSFEAGAAPLPYTLRVGNEEWHAFNIICYDVRFPEIVRRHKPIDVLFVPAAFTWQTGIDHWEVLLRARAIENQCYVVACNQTGSYLEGAKKNYGNSMIIDPWGHVVARLGEEVGILSANISKEVLKEIRGKLPALKDRKIF